MLPLPTFAPPKNEEQFKGSSWKAKDVHSGARCSFTDSPLGAVHPVSRVSGTHNLAAAIVCTEPGISAVSVTLVGPAQLLIRARHWSVISC